MKKKGIPKKRNKSDKKKDSIIMLDEEFIFEREANSKEYSIKLVNKDSSLTADGRRCYELFQEAIVEVAERYVGKAPLYQIEYVLMNAKANPGFQLFALNKFGKPKIEERDEGQEKNIKSSQGEFNEDFMDYNGLKM